MKQLRIACQLFIVFMILGGSYLAFERLSECGRINENR